MQRVEGATDYINEYLRQLFEGHGVRAVAQPGRVIFPAHPSLWASGDLYSYSEGIAQLDVRLGGFDGDRMLIESIAGFGPDLNAQANFAAQALANASFHVLLPAFFGTLPCHGTEREVWTIGHPRAVYAGLITTIFGYPPPRADGTPDLGFYPAFIKRLESCSLPPGTHWLRIYQRRHKGVAMSNEVLLDNQPWEEMQAFMAEQPWPLSEGPYDVRIFLVVKDLVVVHF